MSPSPFFNRAIFSSAGGSPSGIVIVGVPSAASVTVGIPGVGSCGTPVATPGAMETMSATKTRDSPAPTARSVEPSAPNASDGGITPTTRLPTSEHAIVLIRPTRYTSSLTENFASVPSV